MDVKVKEIFQKEKNINWVEKMWDNMIEFYANREKYNKIKLLQKYVLEWLKSIE